MTARVVVLGASFGGLTAALALRQAMPTELDIQVVSPTERFVFNPSLIWLPFGARSADDITFDVRPTLEQHDIEFVHTRASAINARSHYVELPWGDQLRYDALVVATGFRNHMAGVPGMAEHASTITTLELAQQAGDRWVEFLRDPGDVVVAAAQGAGCFGAAYEFLFNIAHHLKKEKLRDRVTLHYVTAEPFLGHFGIGGLPHGESMLSMFLQRNHIDARLGVAIDRVEPGALILRDGTELPSKYTMVIPPFSGQQVVRDSPDLLPDARAFVPVRPTYQTVRHDDVYTVGAAAAVTTPWKTAVPVGVPKTGFPTEVQAHVAARNIVSQLRGYTPHEEKPFADIPAICVMDAGNNGVIILADHMLPPRRHGILIPGPQAHTMKVAFEQYFLWKLQHGYVQLP